MPFTLEDMRRAKELKDVYDADPRRAALAAEVQRRERVAEMLDALADADKLYSNYGLLAQKDVEGVSIGEWIGRVRAILRQHGRKV